MKRELISKNNKRGFTMVETLVAIFILLVSTTGPLSFAQSGLRASFLARDQVVAFYLAQDAIETIKNTRDNNSLEGINWLDGLDDCENSNGCRIQTGADLTVDECFADPCEPMYYNNTSQEYILNNTGSDTIASKYTRTVYVNEIVTDRETQIIVEVEWDSNFFSERRIIVQENMYNWVPAYAP